MFELRNFDFNDTIVVRMFSSHYFFSVIYLGPNLEQLGMYRHPSTLGSVSAVIYCKTRSLYLRLLFTNFANLQNSANLAFK